jgi:hypothetical protein
MQTSAMRVEDPCLSGTVWEAKAAYFPDGFFRTGDPPTAKGVRTECYR